MIVAALFYTSLIQFTLGTYNTKIVFRFPKWSRDFHKYFPNCLYVPTSLLFDRCRRAKPSIRLRLIPSLKLDGAIILLPQMTSRWAKGNFLCHEMLLISSLCSRMECLVLVLLRTIRPITLQDLFFSNYLFFLCLWDRASSL